MLPLQIGDKKDRPHDYGRHGATTLFAELKVATGHVTGAVSRYIADKSSSASRASSNSLTPNGSCTW